MLSLNKAQKIIISHTRRGKLQPKKISEAVDLILAEDIYSREDIPFFTNSAMDGYAVKSKEIKTASKKNPVKLKILGTIQAGDYGKFSISNGTAFEIFTGAPLPKGADAVAVVENSERKGNVVKIFSPVKKGEHIRFKGEEIKKGKFAIPQGTCITPEIAGILANLGICIISVYPPPEVGILVSGNEILDPEKPLTPGKIRDSNSTTLSLLCHKLKIKPLFAERVKDNPKKLAGAIKKAFNKCDYLLISGGVSKGRYDLVRKVLKSLGADEIFWKVAMRPGKPFYFSKKDSTLIFCMPGNPASVIATFYQLVRPSLLYFMGFGKVFFSERKAILKNSVKKRPGSINFLRGLCYLKNNKIYVKILKKQGSNQLLNFVYANCFVVLPKRKTEFHSQEEVRIQIIPGRELE